MFTAAVVLPLPPFWFVMAMVRMALSAFHHVEGLALVRRHYLFERIYRVDHHRPLRAPEEPRHGFEFQLRVRGHP